MRGLRVVSATALLAAGLALSSQVASAESQSQHQRHASLRTGAGPIRRLPSGFALPRDSRTGSAAWIRAATPRTPAVPPRPGTDLPRWTSAPQRARSQVRATSLNWAGYADVGTGFTGALGTWTVPSVAPSQSLEIVATWVGVGGALTTTSLVQTGTEAISTGGSTTYDAWAELITSGVTIGNFIVTPALAPVYPNDQMVALVHEVSAGVWRIGIEDTTQHWAAMTTTFTTTFTSGTSADWITERPLTGFTTRLFTLAHFGSTRFSNLAIDTEASETGLLSIYMRGTTGRVIAYPSELSTATTGSFTNYYAGTATPVTPTAPTGYTRIFGQTADATAAAELEHQFTYGAGVCPQSRAVVLASDAGYADALASGYLARSYGTGTLLTPANRLAVATSSAITKEGIAQVYVVGGPLAISTSVVTAIRQMQVTTCGGSAESGGSVQVTRIWGTTQYDTAAQIATTVPSTRVGMLDVGDAYAGSNPTGGRGSYNDTQGQGSPSAEPGLLRTAILATGLGFQDAESASTLAYGESLPILLTTPSSLSPAAQSALGTLQIHQVIVMGGQLAISNAVVSQLTSSGLSVLRVAGRTSTETAVQLARFECAPTPAGAGWIGTGGLTVARGDASSDGLAGAVVAADGPSAVHPEPLLLTMSPTTVGGPLANFLQETAPTLGGVHVLHLTVLGGPFAVSTGVVQSMLSALS